MTTVDFWPKTLPMPSAQSWNSTTETHLVSITYKTLRSTIHNYVLKTFLRSYNRDFRVGSTVQAWFKKDLNLQIHLNYLSPVSAIIKFWVTTFWFMKVAWLWCFMFHRNQKVVTQKFMTALTGDKYFTHFFLNQIWFHLRKEKWSCLNWDLPVVTFNFENFLFVACFFQTEEA